MKKRKEIIAFDVDGVIFDSTEECLVIAWNAHQELIGKDEKISHKLHKLIQENKFLIFNFIYTWLP